MVNMTAIAVIDAQEKQKKSSYGSVDAVLRKVLITIY
jgi:hypothetical protein